MLQTCRVKGTQAGSQPFWLGINPIGLGLAKHQATTTILTRFVDTFTARRDFAVSRRADGVNGHKQQRTLSMSMSEINKSEQAVFGDH